MQNFIMTSKMRQQARMYQGLCGVPERSAPPIAPPTMHLITDGSNHFYRTSDPEQLLAELWNQLSGVALTVYEPGQWESKYPQLA
jgi:hypothetical protein